MYIYKNQSGIQLTVDEFIQMLEQELLDELVALVNCLDDPDFVLDEIFVEDEETDEERVDRIMKRFTEWKDKD